MRKPFFCAFSVMISREKKVVLRFLGVYVILGVLFCYTCEVVSLLVLLVLFSLSCVLLCSNSQTPVNIKKGIAFMYPANTYIAPSVVHMFAGSFVFMVITSIPYVEGYVINSGIRAQNRRLALEKFIRSLSPSKFSLDIGK